MHQMIEEFNSSKAQRPWTELQLKFGEFLGLDEAVPDGVLERALADEKYASYLISARDKPKYLRLLFKNTSKNKSSKPNLTSEQLLKRASKSFVKWGKSGFKLVKDDVYETRLAGCNGCPHLQQPPENLLYKLNMSFEKDPKMCGKCGCITSRKARLATEACPDAHPTKPGFTRWNEFASTEEGSVKRLS